MAVSVEIRDATRADVELLADLGARTFRGAFEKDNEPADMEAYVERHFEPGRIAAEVASPDNRFLLAFSRPDGAPLGYAKLRSGPPGPAVRGPSPVELERLYVVQEAIGRGVGAALLGACVEAAARAGHQTLWLGVWERNERAIAFYRRWGFEEVGTHVFQLGSDPQTDLVMARQVAPASRPASADASPRR